MLGVYVFTASVYVHICVGCVCVYCIGLVPRLSAHWKSIDQFLVGGEPGDEAIGRSRGSSYDNFPLLCFSQMQTLGKFGMYRNHSLNTALDRSKA